VPPHARRGLLCDNGADPEVRLVLGWMSAAFAVDCVAPVSRSELRVALDEAEAAWTSFRDEEYRVDVDHLVGFALPCLADAVQPSDAARVHTLLALQRFAAGDVDGAVQSAAAARASEPDRVPDLTMVPQHHGLRPTFDAPPPHPDARRVPEPRAGSLAFDGVPTRTRADRPTIVQLFDEAGVARVTDYLGPREPLPSYAAVPRRRRALAACAGVAAGAGLGSLAAAAGSRSALLSAAVEVPDASRRELERMRSTADAWTLVGWPSLAVASACAVGAVAVGPR
jgi:hypothetical protein